MHKREFTVEGEYRYNRAGPARWIISHVMRYPHFPIAVTLMAIAANWLNSRAPLYLGRAFDHVISPERNVRTLLILALSLLGFRLGTAAIDVVRGVISEFVAQRLERDAREELYISLLGKSQTFHSRQRIGDLMARATNDVRQLNLMFSPGVRLILSSLMSLIMPILAIGSISPKLLLGPLVFVVVLGLTIWHYTRQLNPVAEAQREQFGEMNAGLAESVSGIEVVKATAQESQEQARFSESAARYRDLFVKQGEIQARYLPLLAYYIMLAASFMHALLLYLNDTITLGSVIAFMGLLGLLQFPTFISIFTFTLVELGVAGAERILELIKAETELDENRAGREQSIRGEVVFENVGFGYNGSTVLRGISFRAQPGETIAIVGQTGSGKSTLTQLINRIYDVDEGRVLIDGVDVRDWNIASLRSQISTIEQDVFLFARSIADNIAFGVGKQVTRDEIERCAREAQAHDFVLSFEKGYDTEVGERGVTLSGGQRQRIAIARAFLTDPRVLILDDSTSAIDSATEDQIQAAMHKVQQGRTTFLITHRLSQIRWADRILVLRQGGLVDQGTHDELIRRCSAYRRIFARYEVDLPPLEGEACSLGDG
ncbi:MAG: ABC transporter ATP-binding protein [Anaerolineae bacterium]|nr:ABC transporter ATP-binding protein [Anaerolineae bacterium]